MNVELIEMPAEVAREELKKYRASLHRRADVEYEQVADGLEALAKGTPLLQLSRVYADCPRDQKGRPRLAIARADRLRVAYSAAWVNRGFDNFDSAYYQGRGRRARNTLLAIASPNAPKDYARGYALVPMVPPDVRGSLDLSEHFILWEVEQWAENARDVGPDVDPFLLRRISEDLFAVVGSWDLTLLEQAVLAGRRTR